MREKSLAKIDKKLPPFCFDVHVIEEDVLILLMKDVDGYYRIGRLDHILGGKWADEETINVEKLVLRLNTAIGVDWMQREAMRAGAMFGWNVPAADPNTWRRFEDRKYSKRKAGLMNGSSSTEES
jgi:hypothetical protein